MARFMVKHTHADKPAECTADGSHGKKTLFRRAAHAAPGAAFVRTHHRKKHDTPQRAPYRRHGGKRIT